MGNVRAPRNADLIQSVDRAVCIFDMLAEHGWLGGSEVARELQVHRSTAFRLLGTLEHHALVERDPRTAKYRLGPRLPQLARAVTGELDIRHEARPICERLAQTLGETVTIDVLDGDDILPIEQAAVASSFVSVNWLGRRTPIHCTASGKVILAFGPDSLRRALLSRPLAPLTPHSIVDPAALDAQLALIRETGYGSTAEELEIGLSAIAAPVRSADGRVVAALDVSGPTQRLASGAPDEAISQVRDAAYELSRRLGYRRQKVRYNLHR